MVGDERLNSVEHLATVGTKVAGRQLVAHPFKLDQFPHALKLDQGHRG